MEGVIATWYARNTGLSLDEFRRDARKVASGLPAGADVLEVAPGPGYLAMELARLGPFRVTGLDSSRSFVRIARENAAKAGVAAEFVEGDAAALPFADQSFDAIVCRAAFKNFSDPVGALREMHRVLRPGGRALIVDMRRDASDAEIRNEVRKLNLSGLNGLFVKVTFRWLRRRAYSRQDFTRMLAETPFGKGEMTIVPLGIEVHMVRQT